LGFFEWIYKLGVGLIGMKIRNIQKSGNMHYIYLPSKWCKENRIIAGSRVKLDVNGVGNLEITNQVKMPSKDLEISLSEKDTHIISKIIMGCFLNPINSFRIRFNYKLDHKKLFGYKKLLSSTMIEVNDYDIYSEPILNINDSVSVFIIMLSKAKSLIKIMIEDFDEGLVRRYSEDINWHSVMINKAVVASLLHKRDAKRKIVELHYLSLIANNLEKTIDRVVQLELEVEERKKFLRPIYLILDKLYNIFKLIKENDRTFNYDMAIKFANRVRKLKVDEKIIYELLIKKSLTYCSETLIDWAITQKVESQ